LIDGEQEKVEQHRSMEMEEIENPFLLQLTLFE
jgi:hypothetical protein